MNGKTGKKETKERWSRRMNEYMNEKICENNMNINLCNVTNESDLTLVVRML